MLGGMEETSRRRRVPALAPDERRAALVAATVPLLHEHGLDVSTKQIAQAAGVAEGTIFGVYPDKNTLLAAALTEALDPRDTLDGIEAIDAGLDLRNRLARAAELINSRFTVNAHLMASARKLVMAHDSPADAAERMTRGRDELVRVLTELIEPDAALLRRPPAAVARLVLLFCGANSYGPFGDPGHFDGSELVSLILDGLLVRRPSDHGGA